MSGKITLIPQDTDMPIEKWHKKIELTRDNGHKLKMLVIEKILSNPTIRGKEVQKIFFICPVTMYSWINQYNSNGLEGLIAKNPKGRGSGKGNTKYNEEVYVKLKEEMGKSDKKWSMKDKKSYLEKEFNIKPSTPTINNGLRRV